MASLNNDSGILEKKPGMDTISQIENITGVQIKDALQMQLAVQRQLHDQLEIQRTLQLRIEEQGKKLNKMFDQHQQQKQINLRIRKSHFRTMINILRRILMITPSGSFDVCMCMCVF